MKFFDLQKESFKGRFNRIRFDIQEKLYRCEYDSEFCNKYKLLLHTCKMLLENYNDESLGFFKDLSFNFEHEHFTNIKESIFYSKQYSVADSIRFFIIESFATFIKDALKRVDTIQKENKQENKG